MAKRTRERLKENWLKLNLSSLAIAKGTVPMASYSCICLRERKNVSGLYSVQRNLSLSCCTLRLSCFVAYLLFLYTSQKIKVQVMRLYNSFLFLENVNFSTGGHHSYV